jgi:hypothetical protein
VARCCEEHLDVFRRGVEDRRQVFGGHNCGFYDCVVAITLKLVQSSKYRHRGFTSKPRILRGCA